MEQKSRKTWLESGDCNIQYFFSKVKSRIARNRVISVLYKNGVEQRGDTKIGEVAQQYYTELYRSELQRQNNHYHVFTDFQSRVTDAINEDLTRRITDT